ncbi:transporter [Bacillus sp. MUM 116]|uniref:transporter n=1 Tax=Bacillus sp. MUM 116 TaxID=1678002 RepID=UPI0008F5CDFB|nr:transporter [Bacillus sp. MUM 116]OIK05458.1 transporter [Bacillus sp. MUM 116]
MYNQTVYSYINYDQQLERQFPSLPLPPFPGPGGLPGLPGPDFGGPVGLPSLPGPDFGGPGGLPSLPGLPGSQIPQAPTAPPPSFIPQQVAATPFAVDPGAIRLCLFRNTFIWLSNGEGFWFYPIFVGPRSVAGFRWNGWSWMIFGIDTRRIISFSCF